MRLSEMKAEIGVIGGTGFYTFFEDAEEIKIDTPYGFTSDSISLGTIGGKNVAFLPRHGKEHQYPPHMVNYRANLWALKQLGVNRVLGPCAVGSLQPQVHPGDFVFCDQFVDRTTGRKDTFYDGPTTVHLSSCDPYCPELREIGIKCAEDLGLRYHPDGTMVVIQGPRFSTRAESKWFSSMGWKVVNMTGYPEVMLARELGMCYLNISLITDYDVGLEGRPDIKPVTAEEVTRVFNEHNELLKTLIARIIEAIPDEINCSCHEELRRILG
ncbi:MAG TPA: S-methyl-5'-thioadenosine phosphorylase [Bacillota bacterium]|nr:S-methyl-5'-thioadenosine phosphorylase [Bacillota bacterium]HOQ03286.1 S-methyl-5'-thioadenosine phosphorylase [Bacillota bacterium]HPV13737.1 S-methyl-5'-thioadenosine phosphorylase [Bacillota bacterium]HPZ78482.1 S-methyl-5'-thioadenosine phosphorylase [Bacillota bacterium]HQD74587.1 S-methyl-5'-thioadenosine phosphorylase [Bacillota bacterium]